MKFLNLQGGIICSDTNSLLPLMFLGFLYKDHENVKFSDTYTGATTGNIMSTASNTTPSKSNRNELTLEQKIDVIREHELSNIGSRKLAEKFKCGKSQICRILKRKRELEDEWALNVSSKRQRIGGRPHKDVFEDKLFGWFSGLRAKGVPLSGPMLQAKARDLAKEAGIQDFKASNGWLHRFKIYYNIACKTVSGERGDVDLGEQKKMNFQH